MGTMRQQGSLFNGWISASTRQWHFDLYVIGRISWLPTRDANHTQRMRDALTQNVLFAEASATAFEKRRTGVTA